MNAQSPQLPKRTIMRRDDQEFLPAALEILERPASPVGVALMASICAFALLALMWSVFSMTDIVAVARGKAQPTGRVKTVQPLEPGKVKVIRASNGDRVQEGDVLVELDAEDAEADRRMLRAALVSNRAEIMRRMEAVRAAHSNFKAGALVWSDDTPDAVRLREERALAADLETLSSQVRALDAQRAEKAADVARLTQMVAAQEKLVETLRERVAIRSGLEKTGSGTRSSVIDALEAQNYQLTILADHRGQQMTAEAAMHSLAAARERAIATFVSDNTTRLVDARRQADENEPRLAKAEARLARLTLRSPAAGVVQASAITSVGQVLNAGQEAMRIVPDGAGLEIEVYVENKDIGFVREGQAATVKIDAFPFTRHGVVEARVVRIARDAIPDPDARLSEGDPSRPVDARTVGAGQRVAGLVYPVILQATTSTLSIDKSVAALSPGMTLAAEIKTGQRRIIDYLLSPLTEITGAALRER